jgi:hypothetical protein
VKRAAAAFALVAGLTGLFFGARDGAQGSAQAAYYDFGLPVVVTPPPANEIMSWRAEARRSDQWDADGSELTRIAESLVQ